MSHGGLRQKMFNAYEESIRVPLVISNPVLFPEPRESDALVSLVDLVPTLLGLTGAARRPRALRRARPRAAAARRARGRARRGALHLRRPPGRHGVPGRAGPAEPDPLRARLALEVRGLPRPVRRRRRPSTSSTTSRAIPTRRSTSWTSTRAAAGPGPPSRSASGCAQRARACVRGQRHRASRRCRASDGAALVGREALDRDHAVLAVERVGVVGLEIAARDAAVGAGARR